MRILIITDAWYPQVNGVVRTYENLCLELSALGHPVHVMGPRDFFIHFPMPGYKEIELVPGPYGRLKYLINTYNADHLHIATEGPLGWAARRYCLKHNRPFTTSYHTHFPDYIAKRMRKIAPRLEHWAYDLTLRHIKRFHAGSKNMMVATPSLEAQLHSQGFTNPFHRLTRGVDLSVFHPGPKTLFADLPEPVALYVGRIAVEKSIEDFLSMPWHGSKVVVGAGPALEALKKSYPDVIFTGKKSGKELADHYRSADLFVFPSRTDTFGLVLIEALACGLPVAAYPVTGPVDIITEDFLGVLDPDLGKAAAQAVLRPDAARRHAHVRQHYSWRTAAEQFLDAI